MTDTVPTLATSLEAEHRELDQLLGRFLAAATAGDVEAAGAALKEFDEILRSHTRREEDRLYEKPAGRKLVPAQDEAAKIPWSELLLEHVQIREVSGMMRRLLEEKRDLAAARALCGNLARRWEVHTTRHWPPDRATEKTRNHAIRAKFRPCIWLLAVSTALPGGLRKCRVCRS